MTTFVLIPGACHGAWCFDDLATALRSYGHRVLTITLTGVAERAHLLHAGVNLETHITDVVAALATERNVDDLVLVGHSYGGMVITGVADRIPDRVDALVYLDALVPRDGESCWALVNDEERQWYLGVDHTGYGVPPLPFFDSRATAHPLASFLQPIRLAGDLNTFRRRDFVYALQWPGDSPLRPSYERVRDDPNWTTHELDGAHNLMRDNPDDLLRILLDVAGGPNETATRFSFGPRLSTLARVPGTTTIPAIDGWFATDESGQAHLIGGKCPRCGTYVFPPRANNCPNPACDGDELEQVPLSRRGTLWSYTENRYAPPPYPSPDPFEPFAVAAVQLADEGIIVLGKVVEGTVPADLKVGMEMELTTMPLFTDDDGVERVVYAWRIGNA